MENNLLKNFLTIEDFRKERPRMSIMNDEEIQEALNIATTMLDGICNGLISLVVQYSLSREVKDPNNNLYRTDFELNQLKNAIVFQTHYVLNLGNDFTIGSNSASTGGINYSFQRPEARQELAPGVKEFLSRARVYELTNIGFANERCESAKPRLLECLLTKEDAERAFLEKFQPNVPQGSIASISQGHTIEFINPANTNWHTTTAKKILDIDGEYREIDKIKDIAFFGKSSDKAMTRQEIYNAIWYSLFWNETVAYPNEAIIRYYDYNKNLVYTFKSNQDNNINHNPLTDNKDNFWWKEVGVADRIDFDEVADRVINSKEFLKKINDIKNEFDGTLESFWNQIKDNEHLMKKFEELYNQTKTENDQLEQKLDTKINGVDNKLDTKITETNTKIDEINTKFESSKTDINNRLDTLDNNVIKKQLPQEFFNNNTPVLRLTTNTSNDVGVANNSGKMLIGAKNGVEFTSSLNYTSDVAIRENNQLTTKKYVDDAINTITMGNIDWSNIRANTLSISNDNSLVGYDANKTEIRHNNNFIKLTNDGGVMEIDGVKVNIDSNQFNILASNDGTYQPTNPNSLINKNYIDTHFKNYVEGLIPLKLYTIVVNTTSHPFFKEDLKSNALWAYKTITEVSRQVTIPNSLIGKRVFWKVTLTRIYKNNQYVGVVNNYGITTPNTNNLQITMKSNSNWFISGTDLNPGAGGRFNLDVYWLIEVFEVSNDGSTFLEETK